MHSMNTVQRGIFIYQNLQGKNPIQTANQQFFGCCKNWFICCYIVAERSCTCTSCPWYTVWPTWAGKIIRTILKGQFHEIFDLRNFRYAIPPWPHLLTGFCLFWDLLRICEDIRIWNRWFRIYIRKALATLSGAQDGWFNDKNRGSKIAWHCPINSVFAV
jgi:hypothetical protein